uniref:Uncharacterized protein n=1 Tax=Micrurus paraensis TaxID=1970185 RepID=A0A2D4KUU6_9SAUR
MSKLTKIGTVGEKRHKSFLMRLGILLPDVDANEGYHTRELLFILPVCYQFYRILVIARKTAMMDLNLHVAFEMANPSLSLQSFSPCSEWRRGRSDGKQIPK